MEVCQANLLVCEGTIKIVLHILQQQFHKIVRTHVTMNESVFHMFVSNIATTISTFINVMIAKLFGSLKQNTPYILRKHD
jgi:hypothetical protein